MPREQIVAGPDAALALIGFNGIDSGAVQAEIVRALATQRDHVLQADFPALELQSMNCLGLGHALLRVLHGELAQRSRLRQRYASDAAPAASPLDVGTAGLVGARNLAIVSAHRGLLGLVHAAFNTAVVRAEEIKQRQDNADSGTPPAHRIDARPHLKTLLDDFTQRLQRNQAALHDALGRVDSDAINMASTTLTLTIEAELPLLARALASSMAAMQRLKEDGKGGAAEQLGCQCARGGLLLREALASQVSANLVAFSDTIMGVEDPASVLRGSAAQRAFDVDITHGRDVELHHLDTTEDGTFVQVRAFVSEIITHRLSSGLLVSTMTLQDPSSGASATAVAIFAHLAHAGLTRESFVDLSGVWTRRFNLLDGQAGISVDALALGQLSEQSWRVTFLQAAERWYAVWPNGANLAFSLAPQRLPVSADSGADNGAGELVFRKWLRV